MDNIFFGNSIDFGKSNWGFSAVLNGLLDKNSTFDVVYHAIVANPKYVIAIDGDKDRKIRIIDKMIQHYESLEEYEKCNNLLRIKKEL